MKIRIRKFAFAEKLVNENSSAKIVITRKFLFENLLRENSSLENCVCTKICCRKNLHPLPMPIRSSGIVRAFAVDDGVDVDVAHVSHSVYTQYYIF